MQARISFITLAVTDLNRALIFYRDALGLTPRKVTEQVVFFDFSTLQLALYSVDALAMDLGVSLPSAGLGRTALAHNVADAIEVDQLLEQALQGGAVLLKAAHWAKWGAYCAFFADPDGHLWEVVWHPDFAYS
ncbi:VOC family protein [uncultured Deefgea sp.]|uniref:VOC family protein n=1 Tax=uncultured Deefgea sp. TaxID=1304914 RepID=UPI0026229295|nr:VOC family protein [uncultured Deefgea sp.]